VNYVDTSSLNKESSNSQSSVSSTTIGAVVASIVVLLVMIILCALFISKKSNKPSPFELWTEHYSNKRDTTHTQPMQQLAKEYDDIHHFYNRSPRPSINQNPPFTPHLSGKISSRNSQLGGQLGSQRNSQRLSLPMRNAMYKHEL
jgi:hypothetical protein